MIGILSFFTLSPYYSVVKWNSVSELIFPLFIYNTGKKSNLLELTTPNNEKQESI